MEVNYYVYITPNERLIYKKTICDNLLNVNDINCYGHKVILKNCLYFKIKQKKKKIKKNKKTIVYVTRYSKEWWK